jgi:hypothetical protein
MNGITERPWEFDDVDDILGEDILTERMDGVQLPQADDIILLELTESESHSHDCKIMHKYVQLKLFQSNMDR